MKITFALIALLAFNSYAQVEEEPILEIEEVDIMFDDQEPKHSIPSNLLKDYESRHISDGYYWVYTRSENSYSSKKKFGILKGDKFVLPVIFKRHGYSSYDSKDICILSLGKQYGMYSVSQEKWLLPLYYEGITDLKNNIYKVKYNGVYGLVDGSNTTILEPEWKNINSISGFDSYFKVSKRSNDGVRWGVYSILQRKFVIPCEYESVMKIEGTNQFIVQKDNGYNIVNMSNKVQFKTWYKNLKRTRESGNFIASDGLNYGIITTKEDVVVPFEYQEFKTYPFKDGSYLAKNKKGKYGFIRDDGTITLPFEYEAIKTDGNRAISIQKDKCGIIELNNGNPTEIVTCDYDAIERGKNVFIVQKGNKFGFMDESGKEISELKYKAVQILVNNYSESLYSVEDESGFYLVTATGVELNSEPFGELQPIVDIQKDSYSSRRKFKYLKMKNKSGKYQIVDKAGQIVSDIEFDEVLSESENVLTVKMNGKYGMYSLLSRDYLIPCEYEILVKDKYTYYGTKNGIYYSIVPGKDAIPLMAE